jgi:hypothetical protein
MKNLLKFPIMLLLGLVMWSCGGDNTEPGGGGGGGGNGGDPDGVALGFTVYGGDSYTLTDRYRELEYTATLSFPDDEADYVAPTVEFDMSGLLAVDKADVKMSSPSGARTDKATITIDGPKITVVFAKDNFNDNFDYLPGAEYKIVINPVIGELVTVGELDAIAQTGFESSCKFTDEGISKGPLTATVYPVLNDIDPLAGTELSMGMTVNGQDANRLIDMADEVVYTARLATTPRAIEWTHPTLEFSFDRALDVRPANIKVTDKAGAPMPEANVSVDNNANKLTVSFGAVDGGYVYLMSEAVKVEVSTVLKTDLPDAELNRLAADGMLFEGMFWADSKEDRVSAETVRAVVEPFYVFHVDPRMSDATGRDMNDYPYRVNVVYFVPSDQTPNPQYMRRLSDLLFNFQVWVCDWMEHWGYPRQSFGLPVARNGMVDIVTVQGQHPKSYYPYDYLVGAPRIEAEVKAWYRDKNLPSYSAYHTLIITCVNNVEGTGGGVPYYGLGRWAYALDFPGMSQEMLSPTLSTNYIGGLMHEGGHGMNLAHVGATRSQAADPKYGTALMSNGNETYGKRPTFLHHASASTLFNSQLGARSAGTFYNGNSTTINPPTVTIDGNECTVSGTFTSNRQVRDVMVVTHKSNGPRDDYHNTAFVTKASGNSYSVKFSINDIPNGAINPINAIDPQTGYVNMAVKMWLSNGESVSLALPATYKRAVITPGQPNYTLTTDYIDLVGAKVEFSKPLSAPSTEGSESFNGAPEYLVDGRMNTLVSIPKPAAGDPELSATITLDAPLTFSKINVAYRTGNTSANLRATKMSFYASDNKTDWTPLKTGHTMNTAASVNTITLDSQVTTKYLKMTIDAWNTAGSSIQFAEVSLSK